MQIYCPIDSLPPPLPSRSYHRMLYIYLHPSGSIKCYRCNCGREAVEEGEDGRVEGKYGEDGGWKSEGLDVVEGDDDCVDGDIDDNGCFDGTNDDGGDKASKASETPTMPSSKEEGGEDDDDEIEIKSLTQNTLLSSTGSHNTPTDPTTINFLTFCSAMPPKTVIVYDRWGDEGKVPWSSGQGVINEKDVPKCSHCGGQRKFELQIMPTIIHGREELGDFGLVRIYTCVGSCGEGWKEEYCYMQGPIG